VVVAVAVVARLHRHHQVQPLLHLRSLGFLAHFLRMRRGRQQHQQETCQHSGMATKVVEMVGEVEVQSSSMQSVAMMAVEEEAAEEAVGVMMVVVVANGATLVQEEPAQINLQNNTLTNLQNNTQTNLQNNTQTTNMQNNTQTNLQNNTQTNNILANNTPTNNMLTHTPAHMLTSTDAWMVVLAGWLTVVVVVGCHAIQSSMSIVFPRVVAEEEGGAEEGGGVEHPVVEGVVGEEVAVETAAIKLEAGTTTTMPTMMMMPTRTLPVRLLELLQPTLTRWHQTLPWSIATRPLSTGFLCLSIQNLKWWFPAPSLNRRLPLRPSEQN
jgi:hypothetical protein